MGLGLDVSDLQVLQTKALLLLSDSCLNGSGLFVMQLFGHNFLVHHLGQLVLGLGPSKG